MANVRINPPDYTVADITPVQTNILPPVPGRKGTWLIELESTGSWVGVATVKARIDAASAFKPVPYISHYLNGAVGDGAGSHTGNLTSGSSLIEVEAGEREVAIDMTTKTSGTGVLHARFIPYAPGK